MSRRRCLFLPIPVLWLFLSGCANPSYFRINENFVGKNWQTIAVTRFSGNPAFVDVASETFVLHLLEQTRFAIIEPSEVEVKATEIMLKAQGDRLSIAQAQAIGKVLNADGVIVGTVTSYNNGLTLNGFSTVRLVDTRTGEVVASSHKPSGQPFLWSEHQAVVKAVERTANDILKAMDSIKIEHEEPAKQELPIQPLSDPKKSKVQI
jgi:curli biogenesis system outer membrane secretion channel CsgG